MNSRLPLFGFALSVLLTGHAMAADAPVGKTREQVRAELAEAIRTGTIVVNEQGQSGFELAPHRYPARPHEAGKTREQVKAELAEAVRTGDIGLDENGRTAFERAPHRYPARPKSVGKTREQVEAELAEAILLGDTPVDELGRTPAQRAPHVYAAVRAEHARAAKARRSGNTAQSTSEGAVLR